MLIFSNSTRKKFSNLQGVASERGPDLQGVASEGGPDLQGVASEGGPDLQGVASEGGPDLQGVASEGGPDLQGVASEGSLLVGLNEGLGNKRTIRLWVDSRPACHACLPDRQVNRTGQARLPDGR